METAADLLFVPTILIVVLAFGGVIRRLLGVRFGVVRTVLAALLALWITGRIMQALAPLPGEPGSDDVGFALILLLLAVCCGSLLAMILLVVLEVILPDGSLPGPVELWRGGRSQLARTGRYWQIVRIAVRHGLGRFLRGRRYLGLDSPAARRRLARSVRQALDDGGVTFVKLGQQLSTRRDLVPAEFADEFTALQDDAAPVPWPEIEAVLHAELGRDVFSFVDPSPLAAASVAQVHAARLVSGAEVVVKVQRPGIARLVERDLDIVDRLARTLEQRTRWGRALGLRALGRGYGEALREELDFRIERDNLAAVAATLDAGSPIRVPVAELSTERVLVMQRLPGKPLSSAPLGELSPERRRVLATDLLDTTLDQVLRHGLFHVDLHPGNVLVDWTTDGDGTLGLLDFGSVGRLDATTRTALAQLMAALSRSDSLAATDALLELVDRPDEIDERGLERAVGALIIRYAVPGSAAAVAAFPALMALVVTHRLAVPGQVAAVFRAFATIEGTVRLLDPGFDLFTEARAAAGRQVASAVTPSRLRQAAEEELTNLLPVLRRLPRRADRIADAAERGRLGVQVRLLADPRDRRYVTELLHQVLLTVLGAAAGLMAVLMLGIEGGPRLSPTVALFDVIAYGLLIVAAVLTLRVLVTIFRHDRA